MSEIFSTNENNNEYSNSVVFYELSPEEQKYIGIINIASFCHKSSSSEHLQRLKDWCNAKMLEIKQSNGL